MNPNKILLLLTESNIDHLWRFVCWGFLIQNCHDEFLRLGIVQFDVDWFRFLHIFIWNFHNTPSDQRASWGQDKKFESKDLVGGILSSIVYFPLYIFLLQIKRVHVTMCA